MAKNPLIRSKPRMTGPGTGGHKSAGILDDHAQRKVVLTKEAEIQNLNKSGDALTMGGDFSTSGFVSVQDGNFDDLSLRFAGSPTTGIYKDSAHEINFVKEGSRIMEISAGFTTFANNNIRIATNGTYGVELQMWNGAAHESFLSANVSTNEVGMLLDNYKFVMGAAGATDYYQTFDGTDAQFYSSNDFHYSGASNPNIVLTGANTAYFQAIGSGGTCYFGYYLGDAFFQSPDTGDIQFWIDPTGSVAFKAVTFEAETGHLVPHKSLYFDGAGEGLPYAEIYAFDANSTITISGTGIANKIQVTSFDTNGVSNLMTPDHTNDHITVVKAGVYKCNVAISAESSGGSAYEAGFGVFKNNGATHFTNCHVHRQLSGGGGDTGSLNMTGLIDLAANDTIEVWVWNETNTNNIIVDDITLNLIQIGGT